MIEKFVFRADASLQIGTGHVMRCLALAQQLNRIGNISIFVMALKAPVMTARLESEGIETIQLDATPGSLEDARQTAELAKKLHASWIVIDGYHFSTSYQLVIKKSGCRLLVIDDFGSATHYYADVILNQNLYAKESLYSKEPYTHLLLGSRYVLLRSEFLKWRKIPRIYPENAKKIFVTLGGSDPNNTALKFILSLKMTNINGLEAILLCANNSHFEKLQSEVPTSDIKISLKRNISNMPELMAWSDLAVSAAGTTTWELAFMGVPMLLTSIAINQIRVAEYFSKMGAAINLGWHKNLNVSDVATIITEFMNGRSIREELSHHARNLVDGYGALRVTEFIRKGK
jgi:UDP-2,4-diacetamido-2,4,6-trideoxy-beta-L-altropyranose hydrolase